MPEPDDRSGALRSAGPFLNLGFTLALAIAGLAYGGNWLDGRLGTEPWLMLAGALTGMAVGFVNLFRVAWPRGRR